MKNRWAKGIVPRNFIWVIRGAMAVCERPGGYSRNHRRVRRQEEIIWIRESGFTRVVSLLPSPHNLHSYEELDMTWSHIPIGDDDDPHTVLPDLYRQLQEWVDNGERIIVHHEELGDRLMGIVAGYLLWAKLLPTSTQAITAIERLTQRQLGPEGRELVNAVPIH